VPGVPSGFDIDIGALQAGNSVHLTYTDNNTNTQHTVTLMRVDDPSALPLPASATADPNDKVIGINFAAGIGSVVSQISAALGGTAMQFSNPVGTTLRVLDDGPANTVHVDAVSATTTATTLTGGSPELPFFVDGSNLYTGAMTASGSQSLGFAGRIAVNANLLADPSRLVVYQTAPLTPAGDATRPNFLYDQLNSAAQIFSPQSGIGTSAAPFTGSLPTFLRQILSQQGDAAQAAGNLKQGQDVVLNSLQQRFNESAGVNIDEEMANLLTLQNAYSANARVLSAVNDMFNTLMKM
jgi:flagellar hook-associated protein 1 FlgK